MRPSQALGSPLGRVCAGVSPRHLVVGAAAAWGEPGAWEGRILWAVEQVGAPEGSECPPMSGPRTRARSFRPRKPRGGHFGPRLDFLKQNRSWGQGHAGLLTKTRRTWGPTAHVGKSVGRLRLAKPSGIRERGLFREAVLFVLSVDDGQLLTAFRKHVAATDTMQGPRQRLWLPLPPRVQGCLR